MTTERGKKLQEAQEISRLEPSRLLHLVDSRRKSMLEATPELGIVEKSAKEGMERNHFGDSDQDSR